jgi:hypothetical protein
MLSGQRVDYDQRAGRSGLAVEVQGIAVAGGK